MTNNISGSERGILGHWPITEGVGDKIYDTSPNKVNGTITGAAWWMNSESVGTYIIYDPLSVCLSLESHIWFVNFFPGHVDIPCSTLVEDMRKAFASQLGADVRLVAADGNVVLAHKIILAARSEAFRALLYGGMRESQEKEIHFPDIKYEVLSLLVEFLYTDNAHITGDIVVGLFMAADLYQLTRLRALCENFILQNISIENVCTIFQTADQLHAHKLRGFCFNWIINNFGEILTCDAYTQLPGDLQREINHAAAKMHFNKKKRKSPGTSSADDGLSERPLEWIQRTNERTNIKERMNEWTASKKRRVVVPPERIYLLYIYIYIYTHTHTYCISTLHFYTHTHTHTTHIDVHIVFFIIIIIHVVIRNWCKTKKKKKKGLGDLTPSSSYVQKKNFYIFVGGLDFAEMKKKLNERIWVCLANTRVSRIKFFAKIYVKLSALSKQI